MNYNSVQDKRETIVGTIAGLDQRNVWKDNKASRHQDNKNKGKTRKLCTMKNKTIVCYCTTAIDKIYRLKIR